MFLNIDWKDHLKAILKAALPFLLGGAIGVTASGCSSLQTPRAKTQTSAIYSGYQQSSSPTTLPKPLTTPAVTPTRQSKVISS